MKTKNLLAGRTFLLLTVFMGIQISCSSKKKNFSNKVHLKNNWEVQQSIKITQSGSEISTINANVDTWYRGSAPSTVMGVLIDNGVYNDILVSDNLKQVDRSQFNNSWWYRKTFQLPLLSGEQHVYLNFDGISYYANIWFNGKLIGSKDKVFGAFRKFQFDVTGLVKDTNVLAVEVFRRNPGDFGNGFVDWNPSPPDESMGIWRGVYAEITGNVSISNTFVQPKVNTETLNEAWLTISTEVENYSSEKISGDIKGKIGDVEFIYPVELSPREKKTVTLTSEDIASLHIQNPRLWWCNGLGEPNLYNLDLCFESGSYISDKEKIIFGIRDIKDFMNENGYRGYMLNGRKVLIKGAGWTDDIFLRDTEESNETQIQYVKHMNLNTIRFENFWGTSQNIYDLCDKYGLLAMVGWSCHWEWEHYLGKPVDEIFGGIQTEEEMALMEESLHDQIKWLRNHPSILVWFLGSDKLPKPELESAYSNLIKKIDYRSYLACASTRESKISGLSGMKMNGPYEYVAPNYWYVDSTYGGAYGFNTETGPGPQIPVLESLKKMFPQDKLWPINEIWDYHCTSSSESMNNLVVYNTALNNRYGKAENLDDYLLKADAMGYEAIRPMFEAFRVNMHNTTGIIQWMLNSAWPSLYWQLYDYYLLPTSAYYGTRKANSLLQLMYNYGNNSIYAVNETIKDENDLNARISLFTFDSKKIYSENIPLNIESNTSVMLKELPKLNENVFLALTINNSKNEAIANNFYWLSSKKDVFSWDSTTWVYTPLKSYADLTSLNVLPESQVKISLSKEAKGATIALNTQLTNPSDKIAFFVNLKLVDENDVMIRPVFWDDNYISILPGETKTIGCKIPVKQINSKDISLIVNGWNTEKQRLPTE